MVNIFKRLKQRVLSLIFLIFIWLFPSAVYADKEPCLNFINGSEQLSCDDDGNIQGSIEYKWNYAGGNIPTGTQIEFYAQPSSVLNPIAPDSISSNDGHDKLIFSINNVNVPSSGAVKIKAKYKFPDSNGGENRFICCETESTTIKVSCPKNDNKPPSGKKRGMTWGFGGYSDRWHKQGGNWVHTCDDGKFGGVAKLACITHTINDTPDNWCNTPYSTYYSGQDTPSTSNGTRQCDPVNGDTNCDELRHVLCISESDNPYYQRLPPYDTPAPATASYVEQLRKYSPYGVPPFGRDSYKMHPPNPSLVTVISPQPDEYYDGWVDQYVKLSASKIKGEELSLAAGNDACGPGWRMARFDDGKWIQGMDETSFYGGSWTSATPKKSGGWAFHSRLAADANIHHADGSAHPGYSGRNKRTNFFFNRYWVHSTLGGNCY